MKGYIFRGLSGWTVGLWDGQDTDFYFGFENWNEALAALRSMWN